MQAREEEEAKAEEIKRASTIREKRKSLADVEKEEYEGRAYGTLQ